MESFADQFQAIVSLLVQGQDPSELPERHICLDRNQNTIPVGRASKVEAKGFIAAEDNGWFDSQVMSRAHGELVADFDRQVRCPSIHHPPYLPSAPSY